MNKMISCCGLDCSACEAMIAWVNNDEKLRISTAEKWTAQYGSQITPEMVNCSGCLSDNEVKLVHCNSCKIRLCAIDKGYKTCGECSQLTNCELVANVHKFVPEALENLKALN